MVSGLSSRVLVITKNGFEDPRDGGTLRVSEIVRFLTQNGSSVKAMAVDEVCSMPIPGGWRHAQVAVRTALRFAFTGSLTTARWFRWRFAVRLQAELAAFKPDVILCEYSQLFPYVAPHSEIVHIDYHNVEADVLRTLSARTPSRWMRQLLAWESRRVAAVESRSAKQVTSLSVVSNADAERLVQLAGEVGGDVLVVPNGVRDDGFVSALCPTRYVVFVAHLGWRPNIDAVGWLIDEVWPYVRCMAPDLRLRIVGRTPSVEVQEKCERNAIELHADVESVAPFLCSARVAVAPLRAAGGTRLKILEALSFGVPVVATPLGALGLDDLSPRILRVESEPKAFAEAIVHFGNDAHSFADECREAVESYRWSHTLKPLAVLGLRDPR